MERILHINLTGLDKHHELFSRTKKIASKFWGRIIFFNSVADHHTSCVRSNFWNVVTSAGKFIFCAPPSNESILSQHGSPKSPLGRSQFFKLQF